MPTAFFYHLTVKGSDYWIRRTSKQIDNSEIEANTIYANMTSPILGYRFAAEHAARLRLTRFSIHTVL